MNEEAELGAPEAVSSAEQDAVEGMGLNSSSREQPGGGGGLRWELKAYSGMQDAHQYI